MEEKVKKKRGRKPLPPEEKARRKAEKQLEKIKENDKFYTKEQLIERDELNNYLREILGYTDKMMNIPPRIWRKMSGWLEGQESPGSKMKKEKLKYSFKDIENTARFCRVEIDNALTTMHFANEEHRINTVISIIKTNFSYYVRIKKSLNEETKQLYKDVERDKDMYNNYHINYTVEHKEIDETLEGLEDLL